MIAPASLLIARSLLICLLAVAGGFAATLVVTKTADTADGACDADCSLREAVIAAAPGDTIVFSPLFNSPQTIILTNGQIAITKNLTISGSGSGLLTISGNNSSRILRISGGVIVTLNGMNLINGRASVSNDFAGGAIYVAESTLTLTNMTFSNNTSLFVFQGPPPIPGPFGAGGAIYSSNGAISIINSTIANNSVPFASPGIGQGGGIYCRLGSLNITGSTINNNSGEAIFGSESEPVLINVINSTLVGNTGVSIVGGYGGNTSVANSMIADNGGGIRSREQGLLTVNGSVISNSGLGVSVFGLGAIARTTIRNNNAGGIRNSGNLSVLDSTVSNNNKNGSGAGIYNEGSLSLTNSTVTANICSGSGQGGGVFNTLAGNLILTNSTITDNRATGIGGGLRQNSSGAVTIRNSIIAGNISNTSEIDASGVVASQGFNLIGNTAGSSGWISSDLLNRDPRLALLGNNGGATLTHALMLDSPAINAGSNGLAVDPTTNFSLQYDQRGMGRINGCVPNTCTVDIGAYEANFASSPVTIGGRVSTVSGRGVSNARVTLTNSGGTVVFTQSNPFGYYRFTNLAPGSSYTLLVTHKNYLFGLPLVITIDQNRDDLNFTEVP